jgi:hypothetical protein
MHWEYCPVRYGLCFLSIATVAMLVTLRDFFSPSSTLRQRSLDPVAHSRRHSWVDGARILAGAIFAGGILFQICWAGRKISIQWLDALLIMVDVLLLGSILVHLRLKWSWIWSIFIVLGVPLWSLSCAQLSQNWHTGFVRHYQAQGPFGVLEDYVKTQPTPQRTLMLQFRCYPFFGSHREHQMYQPLYIPSPEWAMEVIRSKGITTVVIEAESVRSLNVRRRISTFDICLEEYPEQFHELSSNGKVLLFEVISGVANSGADSPK